MTDTTFVPNTGSIKADWLNDVNDWTYGVTDKAAAVLLTPEAGAKVFVNSSDGGIFKAVVGAAASTYSDNGGSYCGTQFIPTGGNGSTAWVRADGGYNMGLGYQPEWFGYGDIANDTTAFTNLVAAAAGKTVIVGAGSYLLDSISISSKIEFKIDRDAVLKQKTAVAGNTQIFNFIAGSDGSTIDGGVFDGNYTTHEPSYSDGDVWTAARVSGAPENITIKNTTIQNFLHFGLYHGSGDNAIYENIRIIDCGKAMLFQTSNDSTLKNIRSTGIGNRTHALYQHSYEIRDLVNCVIEDMVDDGYKPDSAGLEPNPASFDFARFTDCRISGLKALNFAGTVTTSVGGGFSNLRRCELEKLTAFNYAECFTFGGLEDTTIDSVLADCNYEGGSYPAIRFSLNGIYEKFDASGAVAHNARAISGCSNVILSNAVAMRANSSGVLIQSGNVTLTNVLSTANLNNGFRIDEGATATYFQNAVTPIIDDVVFNGCVSKYNRLNGLSIEEGRGFTVDGGDYSNNGQDSTSGSGNRSGVKIGTNSNIDRINLSNLRCSDTQNWATKTDGASFTPGSTDSDDQYSISLVDPREINIGQSITLKNATGVGDITGFVVEKHLDDIIIEVSGGATFSATGNLTTLTGTFSSSDYDLTGTGAALDTEVTGITWVTNGSEYRRIRRVDSATVAVIGEAFTSDLSGATLQKLTVDIDSIVSQQYGVRIDDITLGITMDAVMAENNNLEDITAASVASAATITLPTFSDYILVTGTTGITSVTASQVGRLVTLRFSGALTLTDGSNLKLAGNFTTTAGDTLNLRCDGTDWYEISRSVN